MYASFSFNRQDLGYAVISRFEEMMRSLIDSKISVLFGDFKEGIPAGIIQKATLKINNDSFDDIVDLLSEVDFPDLSEIICYKKGFDSYIPAPELSQEKFKSAMVKLYSLRCKVAHVKPNFSALDLENLIDISNDVAQSLGSAGSEFIAFINEVKERPKDMAVQRPPSFLEDSSDISAIPHNVPIPDYVHEGGFVGRDDDIKKIKSLLEGRRNVITISGAGGVGKTALALEVVRQFLKLPEPPFDGVVWLSAKENALSYLGIEDVEPTVKNYEELLDTIFQVMGFNDPPESLSKKVEDVATVFEIYPRTLILVDNFETITDDRITNFVLDIEDKYPDVKILITSRKGLGQVERRHELRQLKGREAVSLFRTIAREKGLTSLAKIDESTLRAYVEKIACYPLAIKWVIGQVALGKNINDVIDAIHDDTSDISKFSFEQIFDSLSADAKKIIFALSIMDEKPSTSILNHIVGIEKNDFEDALRDLILVSLVVPEQYKSEQEGHEGIATSYTLLSLTRGYVRQRLDSEILIKNELQTALQNTQSTIEDVDRIRSKTGIADMGAVTNEEKLAASYTDKAFRKVQAGRYADAVDLYRKATEIAPHFASIYRNWAVVESQQEGHFQDANKLFSKAASLNPSDFQIWLSWGDACRKQNRITDALKQYQKAFEINPHDCVLLNAYGQAKSRSGQYKEADLLFKQSLKDEGASSRTYNEIINLTSIAENLIRWSEIDRESNDYASAESKLQESLEHCEKLLELDQLDPKSHNLLRKIYRNLGFLYLQRSDIGNALTYFEKAIVHKPIQSLPAKELKDTTEAIIQAGRILVRQGRCDEAKKYLPKNSTKISMAARKNERLRANYEQLWSDLYAPEANSEDRIRGTVKRFNPHKGYGFITDGEGNDFFVHLRSVRGTMQKELKVGQRVTFAPNKTPKGQAAIDVICELID